MAQSFIREAIIQGVFRPGERLNLDAIASSLGVSRMPVRASLRHLEGEGLLTIHAHRGATVTVLGPKDIAEVYELQVALESYLLEELKASDESPSLLHRRRAVDGVLYSYADQPRATALVDTLRAAVGHYLLLQRVEETPVHEELLEFLSNPDLEGAQSWLATHLSRVSDKLQYMVSEGN